MSRQWINIVGRPAAVKPNSDANVDAASLEIILGKNDHVWIDMCTVGAGADDGPLDVLSLRAFVIIYYNDGNSFNASLPLDAISGPISVVGDAPLANLLYPTELVRPDDLGPEGQKSVKSLVFTGRATVRNSDAAQHSASARLKVLVRVEQ